MSGGAWATIGRCHLSIAMEFLPATPLQPNTVFFFGFLLFCGALGGYLAHRVPWIPSITGFMLVGLLAGPNVLGVFDYAALEQARLVIDIALALILYRLGLSLDVKALLRDRALLGVSLVESGLTFAAVFGALVAFGLDPLASAVMAAIAISSSPAVLLHVAHELRAGGPATERAQALVALNNVIAFLVFAALMPALYRETDAGWLTVAGAPLYQLLGSALLGGLAGVGLHYVARLTKRAAQYGLALVVGAVAMTLGLALTFGLSALFAPLVLGAVVRSLEERELIADLEFGPAFELFFIALFVYAGANLHLREMWLLAPAAGVFVLARCAAKWVGVAATGWLVGWPRPSTLNVGLMPWPMAGMAIGLANTTASTFPVTGAEVAAVVLAAVAVFETIGPPVVARALRWAGETHEEDAPVAQDVAEPAGNPIADPTAHSAPVATTQANGDGRV